MHAAEDSAFSFLPSSLVHSVYQCLYSADRLGVLRDFRGSCTDVLFVSMRGDWELGVWVWGILSLIFVSCDLFGGGEVRSLKGVDD